MKTLTLAGRLFLIQALTIFALAGMSGCGGEITTGEDASAGILTLTNQRPEEIRGSFTREGVTTVFAATKIGSRSTLSVSTPKGQILALSESDGAASKLVLLGGRLSFSGEPMTMSGDPAALAELLAMKEAQILPWLSQELGAQGISGRSHPASFALHGFAHFVAEKGGITLPPLTQRMSLAADFAAQANGCKDLRNDPYKNGCYGMCGRGCGCWSWVCGDCCWHKGCANHDKACRNCGVSNPGACAACASFSAFFTGGGC